LNLTCSPKACVLKAGSPAWCYWEVRPGETWGGCGTPASSSVSCFLAILHLPPLPLGTQSNGIGWSWTRPSKTMGQSKPCLYELLPQLSVMVIENWLAWDRSLCLHTSSLSPCLSHGLLFWEPQLQGWLHFSASPPPSPAWLHSYHLGCPFLSLLARGLRDSLIS
jgi:hypothetical protein